LHTYCQINDEKRQLRREGGAQPSKHKALKAYSVEHLERLDAHLRDRQLVCILDDLVDGGKELQVFDGELLGCELLVQIARLLVVEAELEHSLEVNVVGAYAVKICFATPAADGERTPHLQRHEALDGGPGRGFFEPARLLPTKECSEEGNQQAEQVAQPDDHEVDHGAQRDVRLPAVHKLHSCVLAEHLREQDRVARYQHRIRARQLLQNAQAIPHLHHAVQRHQAERGEEDDVHERRHHGGGVR
jgi:hypothetical protein